ncbi:HAMP domain-containing sensor histidine kinase [Halolamina sp.]|uniref:HAMP domain-containing sensor histidine kinase n=1 Tax=Halolamina sp. TaxID=1940283 RepID=UPI000677D747
MTHGPVTSPVAVMVRESPETDEVVVEIFDDAMLVTSQEKNSLTEGTETPLQHGSDITLWLVKWMAVNSGGELSVMENDSGGTTFEIRLLMGQAPAEEGDSE